MTETIVWISGATQGVGLGLARHVPYPNARIINLSRRAHPDYESVQFDLTDPQTYGAVQASFTRELANFKGARAIFIHNAFRNDAGYVSEIDPADYAKSIQANAVAPQILGDMFLRAVKPGYESGLVQISSASARFPYAGNATYCAAKAAVEMWVRVVKQELEDRGRETWVVAVRPGFIDTPATRAAATLSPHTYPAAPAVAQALAEGGGALMSPDDVAPQIWAALPPPKDKPLLFFGEMVGAKS